MDKYTVFPDKPISDVGQIPVKDEYLLYRAALKDHILKRKEMEGVEIIQLLYACEDGLKRLKSNAVQL